jgi:hypothetical protein
MSDPSYTKPQNLEHRVEADTKTDVVEKDSDSITALAALYQGEKTDAAYLFNTAMVMMGVAVAYLVGAMTVVGKPNHELNELPWPFLLLLPIPLWLIIAFHSLITVNAMSHGISVRIIEDALFEASQLGHRVKRDMVGSAAGDKIMDITQAKPAHILTTVVIYAGVAFLVVGFTAYALYTAWSLVKNDVVLVQGRVVGIAITIYFI